MFHLRVCVKQLISWLIYIYPGDSVRVFQPEGNTSIGRTGYNMSASPLLGNGTNETTGGGPTNPDSDTFNTPDKNENAKPIFNESSNIIHCNLSINSTTIYTYDNNRISPHKLDLNYLEIITQKLGEINEVQENRMDHLNLLESININNKNIQLVLYYKKIIGENNDLLSIVILCSNKLMSSFVHNLLERLANEYVDEYYKINRKFEFKLRMKDIIQQEEEQLNKLVNNYGAVDNDINQVKELMNENIDKILQRGENLDSLVHKTSNLNLNSNNFRRRTISVKRRMFWANFKFVSILIIILVVIGYVLLGLECGLPFYGRCLHPGKPNQPPS